MMRALIVDSGMRNLGGHNFSYTRSVQRALAERGITSSVLTHRSFPADLAAQCGFEPTFTFGAYDFPPGHGWWSDLRSIYAQAVAFASELEVAFARHRDADVVFSHTLGDFELIGWQRFLARNEFRGRLVLLLRTTPYFRGVNPAKVILHPYWRIKPHSLNAIRRRLGDRFLFVTDSDALSEDYAEVYSHPIVTLPIPLPEQVIAAGDPAPGDSLLFGYLGDARPAKGFHLLPEVIRRVLDAGDVNVRFVIQCPPAASARDDELPAGVEALRSLAPRSNGKLLLIEEHLDEAGYASLLRSLDAILLPYVRAYYVAPTSGIFAEALALGKPVVVPSRTWMSRALSRSGGGVEFESENIDDLAGKVRELAMHYDRYGSAARSFSAEWRAFHRAGNLVTMLLDGLRFESLGVPA